jgi:ribosomal protein S18 acetylase RimI-like enzyme
MAGFEWVDDIRDVDLDELSNLYRIAPLGEKPPAALATVFTNSMFKCFVYAGEKLIGAGRALADGVDCAYIADVAVHPDHQGRGLGKAIIRRLVELSSDHKKVILYANPGTEGFYRGLGFLHMNTAMGIWHDREGALRSGVLSEGLDADPHRRDSADQARQRKHDRVPERLSSDLDER